MNILLLLHGSSNGQKQQPNAERQKKRTRATNHIHITTYQFAFFYRSCSNFFFLVVAATAVSYSRCIAPAFFLLDHIDDDDNDMNINKVVNVVNLCWALAKKKLPTHWTRLTGLNETSKTNVSTAANTARKCVYVSSWGAYKMRFAACTSNKTKQHTHDEKKRQRKNQKKN